MISNILGSAANERETPNMPPRGARTPGKFSVWVKLSGNWTSAFCSNDYADAKCWANEHVRFGGAVDRIELRDLSGKVEPIYEMTWPS